MSRLVINSEDLGQQAMAASISAYGSIVASMRGV